MIDYDLKSRVLELGLDDLQRQVSKALFYHDFPNENVECQLSYEFALHYDNFYSTKYPDLWNEAKKINHAKYERVHRLKFYISRMLQLGDCLFLTFTFNDKCLNSTSASTRKTYVQRYLKNLNTLYVANIDFGKKNKREHFHAVVLKDKVDFKQWVNGNLDGERVRSTSDFGKIAQYVAKLTNHAIKETTKRCSMIYSRMTFQEFERLQYKNNFKLNFVESDEQCVFESEFVQDCLFD